MSGWLRVESPFTCQCCGELKTLGWAGGHLQCCDVCRGHWTKAYRCNGKRYAEALGASGQYVRATTTEGAPKK